MIGCGGKKMRKVALALMWIAAMGLLAPAALAGDEGKPKPYFKISGFYAFNAYSQNNFFFGAKTDSEGSVGGVSDKDEYAIQLVRLLAEFGMGDNVKMVVRADLAQSIWGIDNNQREVDRGGFSNLFNRKGTNFLTHFDWAYVDFNKNDWNVKLGRMKYALGNLLVLDQDSDGVQFTRKVGDGSLTLGWAKMSEGADSLSDYDAIGPNATSAEDATLYTVSYKQKSGAWNFNPFLAFYKDDGDKDGFAYIPDNLQYFRARFTPQITQATVLGLAFSGKSGSWEFKGEVDYLTGDDDIANDYTGDKQQVDINNGDLDGYNLYLDAKVPAGPGKLGFVFGMGSGDDDPLRGSGNINKIRTNGFFYVTEVWEDSVMPDEEGITPQGLGSPASRGYREFENTTLFQVNYNWKISDTLSYFISGTWMQATEPIFAWSEIPTDKTLPSYSYGLQVGDLDNVPSSDDLGTELDMRLTWKLQPGLVWILRGGVFWPGDGAGYLINGTNLYDDKAYELRTIVKYTFGGIKVGG
ncbi:MAG: hypothetical protein Q9Q13_03990 [Acidobacteriota bacterium]|nr:hypothetical protein [Acidobacteriota bacterium]